ncbi:MAG: penicillin-binding protein 1C [Ignavibacteria bacterium]|nr:penicillin-binding protein 1C [Ignavibacteria bacterium]MBT8390907.1 penicillin-binding protein 1C [Ignavibacteria bacterium]NNJ52680.1 penicillin-binding protein 1C [Ignavibacteriaceae bacterium]NNL20573.1 penicillin-binding protein 1C [Ignavibacteriaceae bacterium]
MHFEFIKKYRRSVTIVFSTLLLFILLDLLFPLPKQKEFSKQIQAKDGTLLTAYLTSDDKWRLRSDLEEVSPELIKAIIEKEDNWFYWHFGINPVSVVRAFYKNLISSEIESGASTITMQVARMLEPKERTYVNKFAEMFRALQLELKYSKEEILELYLSLLPFGGNIEGVKSASYIYFNRPPDKLSLAQSIMLAVIPNDPNSLRLDRSNDQIIIKRNYWINKFKQDEIFSSTDLKDAVDEPIEAHRYEVPVFAPHFSYYIKENFNGDELNTTLDLEIQQTVENILLHNVGKVFYKGITNGAVLVMNNINKSVVAYCGSADFYDEGSFGQVNGITAIRSPGSTLKAPLYAYALDDGNLTPKMKFTDIPTDFHGYQPENYDLKFYGNVSTEFALVNSLNIPAVKLLEKVGLNNFINLLEGCGFNQIQEQKNKLGLSLILGGCGTNLFELTRLFTSFANKGNLYPINFLLNEENNDGVQIFSESSSYLIAKILSGVDRSDIVNFSYYSKLPKFAWKTGTSYGKRDAWAIGFNPNYTIGVWMGNFNGVGSPNLSGGEVAVPLLFDLFSAIDYNSDVKWFEEPEDLYKRNVCSESGLVPTQYCKRVVEDFAIKNKSHNDVCNIHKPVYVSLDESTQYCTGCLPSSEYKKVTYAVYQPELTVWLSQNNYSYKLPPAHNPDCNSKFAEAGPKILSPSEDYEYLVEENSEQEILLLAASDSRVQTHYWYINDKFYKKCKPGERVFFNPEEKNLMITCLDDKGRDKSIKINVKYY